jgi:tetratricopeptide (TPR) repeat protein
MQRLPLALLLSIFSIAPASAGKGESWLEIQSPHFTVVTNASEKQGRRLADQFERMRLVFHAAFPQMDLDLGSPIIVLGIKDEKDFRTLEPEAYLAKGSLRLGGLFLRAADKNYVLMRLDAEGDHPYATVYHEYTHLLTSKAADWMPLWMNEGLAEFYQNTEIREKNVAVGGPDAGNIYVLHQTHLLPLETLFKIDEKSPYYHEENKGSIFYAESWALMQYLQTKDFQEKTNRLTDYAQLLSQKVDPVTAAERAFGDLKQLYSSFDAYIWHGSYGALTMRAATDVDDSAFRLEPLTPIQADAVKADFLAYDDRAQDAKTLLSQVLRGDPKNVSACETMGFLAFRQGHLDEAQKWYAQAVQLDSQSFLDHYYYAAISMRNPSLQSNDAQIETSLRASIKLNPLFAPSFDQIAVFLAMRRHDLDEAHKMELIAISLDPADFAYRLNIGNILMMMGQSNNALAVLRQAYRLAKSPQESEAVQRALANLQRYIDEQEPAEGEKDQ